MIDYEGFLSHAAGRMKASAIRKMGGMVGQGTDVISFAPGFPAADMFPWEDFEDIARTLLSERHALTLQYGPTRGYRPLLDAIAEIMAQRHAPTTRERLLITTGSQQGLDLVARVLLNPNDVILVELPTYTGAISAFRNVCAEMVGVRQDADGIDLAELDAVLVRLRTQGKRARVLYLVPNFQNPTGLLIGQPKRRALLAWADRHDVLIVEDDPYRDLYFPDCATEADVRSIRADDASGRVIYLSSFSKTLAPGFRVAWIDAPPPLVAKFELAKQAADLDTGELDQRVIYEAVRRGVLDRRLPLLRAHYQHKRDVMIDALHKELGPTISGPDPFGGFFLWATLPKTLDADKLIPRAIAHGVTYVAGDAFYVDGQGQHQMRLCFSAPTPERIEEGIRRLAAAIREELSVAGGSGAMSQAAR
jgi:2-aminoadipate transaminase